MKQPEIAGVIDQIIGDPMDGIVVVAQLFGVIDRLVAIVNWSLTLRTPSSSFSPQRQA